MKTIEDITADKNLTLHHTAWGRGYVSRKTAGKVEPYEGRWGKGYKVLRPSWDSTRYIRVEYYVEK